MTKKLSKEVLNKVIPIVRINFSHGAFMNKYDLWRANECEHCDMLEMALTRRLTESLPAIKASKGLTGVLAELKQFATFMHSKGCIFQLRCLKGILPNEDIIELADRIAARNGSRKTKQLVVA